MPNQKNTAQLPFQPWEDFPLFFTVEYPVQNFPEEVRFWSDIFGVEFLSLDDSYAIVRNQDGSTFSFKQKDNPSPITDIRIQWFTDQLDSVLQVLDERSAVYEIIRNSEIQRFARMQSPGGMTVEIWSGAEKEE